MPTSAPAGPRIGDLHGQGGAATEGARVPESDSTPTKAPRGVRRDGADLDRVVDRLRERHGFGAVVRGRAIDCLARLVNDPHGFRLRTPSCSA